MPTIQQLNDKFRASGFRGGKAVMTKSVELLPPEEKILLWEKVKKFENFEDGNDPYKEHDFGAICQNGVKYFWKIDYYNADLSGGSKDPSDDNITIRVLTIMQAKDY